MAIKYTITTTVTTASPTGYVRHFHGSLAGHIGKIVTCGINADMIAECSNCGGKDFWTTLDHDNASYHGDLTASHAILLGGIPSGTAILAFDLPVELHSAFKDKEPEPWLIEWAHGHQWIGSACHSALTESMINVEITLQ